MWIDAAQAFFDKLKFCLNRVSVLVLPNSSKEFLIETDASSEGIT